MRSMADTSCGNARQRLLFWKLHRNPSREKHTRSKRRLARMPEAAAGERKVYRATPMGYKQHDERTRYISPMSSECKFGKETIESWVLRILSIVAKC